MLLLILGFVLWAGFHGLKRIALERRSTLGGDGKAAISVGILSGLFLITLGYQTPGYIEI